MSAHSSLKAASAPLPIAARERRFLSLPDVVARYAGVYSKWTIYEMTRTGSVPHRKLAGRRGLLFPLDELEAWEDGAPLETLNLVGGGRVCRPIRDGGGQ
jgi:predicted DNA-binding transcriptional regulator AlpA